LGQVFDQESINATHNAHLRETVTRWGKGCSPKVLERISAATVKPFSELNSQLEGDFDPTKVRLDEINTPHDLIRYLHRMGNYFIFQSDNSPWHGQWGFLYKGEGISVKGLTLDESFDGDLEKDPFLNRLKEICDSGRFRSKLSELNTFQYIYDKGLLAMQMNLGEHYANMQIESKNGGHGISLKYVDSDPSQYDASWFRTKVASKILEKLGLAIDINHNIVNARIRHDNLEDALETYEWLLRFGVATRDVDCLGSMSKVSGRLDDTVDAFFSGVINLYEYIKNYSVGHYEAFAKGKGSYVEKSPVQEIPNETSEEPLEKGTITEDEAVDQFVKSGLPFTVSGLKMYVESLTAQGSIADEEEDVPLYFIQKEGNLSPFDISPLSKKINEISYSEHAGSPKSEEEEIIIPHDSPNWIIPETNLSQFYKSDEPDTLSEYVHTGGKSYGTELEELIIKKYGGVESFFDKLEKKE